MADYNSSHTGAEVDGVVSAFPSHASRHAPGGADELVLTATDVGAVPNTRTVNGQSLSNDITLSAADVSAVPTTRKVNNKALSSNISLDASDVEAVALDSNGKADAAQTASRIVSVTSSKTLALSDAGTFQRANSGSEIQIKIPLNSSVAFPTGTEIEIMQYGTGPVSVTAASGVTIVSVSSLRYISTRYATAGLKKMSTDTWLLSGSLGTSPNVPN